MCSEVGKSYKFIYQGTHINVAIPVDGPGVLLWQATGTVLQWSKDSRGDIHVLRLHKAGGRVISYDGS